MLRSKRSRLTASFVSIAALLTALAPATLAAPPKATADKPPPTGLYCDHLPADLPLAYTCIAEETITLVPPERLLRKTGGATPAQAGVSDKWHWSRSAIIYAIIYPEGTVGSVRETQKVTLNGRRSDSEQTMAPWSPGSAIKPTLTSTCIKDNSWFADANCKPPTTVIKTVWTTWKTTVLANFYHADDDLYWWKYERKFYLRDHPNPSTPDGVFYAPEGKWGYVGSANFNCDKGFPPTEVCRFN